MPLLLGVCRAPPGWAASALPPATALAPTAATIAVLRASRRETFGLEDEVEDFRAMSSLLENLEPTRTS
jgi:hypothetical protein